MTAWNETPVIITVAPCGAEVTRDLQPAVPYTPSEIAAETIAAAQAGATIVHLHVREPDGTPTHRIEVFATAIAEIKRSSRILCNVSTGGAISMTLKERMACLEADTDLAGIETGSLNFAGEPFVTPASATAEIIERAAARGLPLEAECFDLGHVVEAARLHRLHPDRICFFNLVVGVPGGSPATPESLQAMINLVPSTIPWGVTAIGRHQRRMLALALLLGATGIRVGFEDNVYLERAVLAASNAQLVEQTVHLVETLGRRVATVDEAATMISQPSKGALRDECD